MTQSNFLKLVLKAFDKRFKIDLKNEKGEKIGEEYIRYANLDDFKDFTKDVIEEHSKEIQATTNKLITKEIVQAQLYGQSTSRLTSLFNKINDYFK